MKLIGALSGSVLAMGLEIAARADGGVGCDVGCTTQNVPVSPLGLAAVFFGLSLVGLFISRKR